MTPNKIVHQTCDYIVRKAYIINSKFANYGYNRL
jgi:hypothetical protein